MSVAQCGNAPFLDFRKIVFKKIAHAITCNHQKIPVFIGGYFLDGEAAFPADIFYRVVCLNFENLPNGIFAAATGIDVFSRYFIFFHISKILISFLLR